MSLLVKRTYRAQRVRKIAEGMITNLSEAVLKKFGLIDVKSIQRDFFKATAVVPNYTTPDVDEAARLLPKLTRHELEELILLLLRNVRSAKVLEETPLAKATVVAPGNPHLRVSCIDKTVAG